MNDTLPLLAIAGAMLAGAISPGPSFVMVARTAIAASRADGLAAALGMGIGGVLLSCAALAGLHFVLAAVPALYLALKAAGGIYLLYLGLRIWRGAHQPLTVDDSGSGRAAPRPTRSFLLGLGTQLSNPKTSIVYASIFAALLPDNAPLALTLAIPPLIFAIETLWYSLVALALSASAPRAAYLRHKAWFDRVAGGVVALLGIKLLSGAGDA